MEVHEEDEGAEDHADVADHVHHERLARSHDRRVALIPEADQQVRAQADHRPADYQEDEVVGEDEQEHGEDEDVHVSEEAGIAGPVLMLHVAHRIGDDQPTYPGDDEAHEDRQVVDQDPERHLERSALDPGPVGEVARGFVQEQDERGDERKPDHARTDDHGHHPGGAPAAAGQDDRPRRREQEDEQREEGVAQPLSSLRSSMSSASRTRKMSTRIASPTTASAAATVIDISAKSWPSMLSSCREKATRARFAALSISSIEIRMTSGLRRTKTPAAPSTNRTALRRRNQEASSCSPPMFRVLTNRRRVYGSGRSRR